MTGVASGLVGRDGELATVVEAASGLVPWLTIVGPGGIGKSTLALAAVSSLGVPTLVVSLAPARDEESLVAVLERAVELTPGGGDAAMRTDRIGVALAARGPLVVLLDNAEAVAGPLRRLMRRLLPVVQAVRWIATSRSGLGLEVEHLLDLQPLGVPPVGAGAEAVWASASGQVFRDRILRRRAESELPEAGAVGDLLRALGGNPLAIVLAAGRTDVLGVADIRERLTRDLAVLAEPDRDDERHGSILAILQWSWDLLDPAERALLRQTARFRAPFRLIDAERVAALTDGHLALDVVHRLRRKSWLRVGKAADGQPKFTRDPLVRTFVDGRRRADPDPGAELRYVRLMIDAGLSGTGRHFERRVLESRAGDLLQVVDLVLDHLDGWDDDIVLSALKLLDRLGRAGWVDASRASARAEAVLATHADRTTELVREAIFVRVRARATAGTVTGADWTELSDLVLGADPRFAARAERLRAVFLGDAANEEVEASLARTAERLEADGDHEGTAEVQWSLAQLALAGEDLDTARARCLDAIEASAGEGDGEFAAWSSLTLGWIDWHLSDLDSSREHLAASARWESEHPDHVLGSYTRAVGALVEEATGRLDRARAALAAVIAAFEGAGDPHRADLVRIFAGLCALNADDAPAAVSWFEAIREWPFRWFGRSMLPVAGHALALARIGETRASAERATAARAMADATPKGSHRVAAELLLLQRVALLVDEVDVSGRLAVLAHDPHAGRGIPKLVWRGTALTLARLGRPVPTWPGTDHPLLVSADAAWALIPGATERLELGRKPKLQRLLEVLADAHATGPAGVGSDALIEVVWPGERFVGNSGRNRLHVLLNAFRKAGFRDVLLGGSEGTRLDPDLQVVRLRSI